MCSLQIYACLYNINLIVFSSFSKIITLVFSSFSKIITFSRGFVVYCKGVFFYCFEVKFLLYSFVCVLTMWCHEIFRKFFDMFTEEGTEEYCYSLTCGLV